MSGVDRIPAPFAAADVHVVVVNWNAAEETSRCLANLSALEPAPGRVHVVDNGSTDGSAERVARERPDVLLHRHAENRGFAAGANTGVRAALAAGARAVLLLNHDARVGPDALGRLGPAAQRPLLAGADQRMRQAD